MSTITTHEDTKTFGSASVIKVMFTEQQQQPVSTIIQIVTSSVTGTDGNGNPYPTPTSTRQQTEIGGNSFGGYATIVTVAAASGGFVLVVFVVAWLIRRRESVKKNDVVLEMGSNIHNDQSSAIPPAATPDLESLEEGETAVPMLGDVDLDTQRYLIGKHSSTADTKDVSIITSHSENAANLTATMMGIRRLRKLDVEKLSSNTQLARETAPTSNLNLERHLQRCHGTYHTWSHELVLEWARLKRLDPAIFKLTDLFKQRWMYIHSKKNAVFKIFGEFIQAVEFLNDSSQVINHAAGAVTVTDDVDVGGEVLPQYEDATNQ
ncbi:hypothetical protein HDU76_002125 [Blyttiomyces sp. JEL0837]|nr:hypothetical protein HDU76_002125 [Blyttiomyces sp. JEL0837]